MNTSAVYIFLNLLGKIKLCVALWWELFTSWEQLVKRSVVLQVVYCRVNHLGLMARWKRDQRIETERSQDCKPYLGRPEEGWKDAKEGKVKQRRKDRARRGLYWLIKPKYVSQSTFTIAVGVRESKGKTERGEGGAERERKNSKKAHKSSMHLFNFHTRRDFYKLLWQSWEAGE